VPCGLTLTTIRSTDALTNDTVRAGAAATATGRRPALTREQILTAAVAIIDADGVEALTMRRLGQALDRDPMAIYRHAADKDALLDGVVEHVAAELVTRREPDSDGCRN
jgi:AcrR family transcriptional regulator